MKRWVRKYLLEWGYSFYVSVLCLLLCFAAHSYKSERDALREEVAEQNRHIAKLYSYIVPIPRGWPSIIEDSWIPPKDTTNADIINRDSMKFVRVRDVLGFDTMPLIVSCSLFTRAKKEWSRTWWDILTKGADE